ncbi:MAG: signal peptidase I [Acetatifactor sp.]
MRGRGLSFYKRKKKISPLAVREGFVVLFGMATSVFIAVVLTFFFGTYTNMVGASMEPDLYNGQRIYVNRFSYILSTPKTGDVVVFLPNGNTKSHYYVKRVVACPGDTVLIQNGVVYVNGAASSWVDVKVLDPGIAGIELTLEAGQYFCMGDNPGSSEDSRSANIGPIRESDIVGEAWLRMGGENGGMGLIH